MGGPQTGDRHSGLRPGRGMRRMSVNNASNLLERPVQMPMGGGIRRRVQLPGNLFSRVQRNQRDVFRPQSLISHPAGLMANTSALRSTSEAFPGVSNLKGKILAPAAQGENCSQHRDSHQRKAAGFGDCDTFYP